LFNCLWIAAVVGVFVRFRPQLMGQVVLYVGGRLRFFTQMTIF
jgi:hypothetical protein